MEIEIEKIIVREKLYPRLQIDTKKVQEYSENIEKLPPIELNQHNVLIDGMHRIKAYKQVGIEEIEYVVFETKDDDDIYMRAIEVNATHGIQLSYKDKKKIAIEVTKRKLEKDDDATEIRTRLVKVLSVADDTYNKWTKNIREDYDKQIKVQIIREYLEAEYTQQQVAEKFDVSQDTISKNIQSLKIKINLLFSLKSLEYWQSLDKKIQNKLLKEYRTVDEIPTFDEFYNRLRKDFGELSNFKPNPYNIWSYGGQGDTDTTVFGTLPQNIVEQLIHYYTEPFDVVYDPFGGAGITVDACKKWYRRYYVSDMNPTEIAKTKGVKQWKIQDGLPKILPVPKLVFLDPPYWKQAKGKYSNSSDDIANTELKIFYECCQENCPPMDELEKL